MILFSLHTTNTKRDSKLTTWWIVSETIICQFYLSANIFFFASLHVRK